MAGALFGLLAATSAFAKDARVTVQSNKSYDQTVEAFKMGVSKGGMMVMATVNQGNMLKMTGLSMNGSLFLIGNPNVGKQVLGKDASAGLYLPIRVYIYQGADGKTYLSYDKPSVDLKPFGNQDIDKVAKTLDQKLDMLTHMVAQ